MSQIQAGPYQPIHFYDAPEVVFSQFLDDELTFGSFVDTFFDPDQLSPIQRTEFTDDIKNRLGFEEKGVGSALVDVATNPLVWLGFLFLPGGLRASGRLFAGHVKNSLNALPFKNAQQMLAGTPAMPELMSIGKARMALAEEFRTIEARALQPYLERRGISMGEYLRPATIKDEVLRETVELDQRLIEYHLRGDHRARSRMTTQPLFQMNEIVNPLEGIAFEGGFMIRGNVSQAAVGGRSLRPVGTSGDDLSILRALNKKLDSRPQAHYVTAKDGSRMLRSDRTIILEHNGKQYYVDPRQTVETMHKIPTKIDSPALIDLDLDSVLRSRGLFQLRDGYRDAMNSRAIRMYMKDGTTLDDVNRIAKISDHKKRFEAQKQLIDTDKVFRIKRALGNNQFRDETTGMPALMDVILSREQRAAILRGESLGIKDDKFLDLVATGMGDEIFRSGSYFPRNVTEFYTYKSAPGVADFRFQVATGMERPSMTGGGAMDIRNMYGQMFASGRSARRMTDVVPYHMDDLQQLAIDTRRLGGKLDQGWANHRDLSMRIMSDARPPTMTGGATEGRVVPMRRMGLIQSLGAYEMQTAVDYAMYIKRPDALTLAAQRELLFDAAGNARFSQRATDFGARAYSGDAKIPPKLMQVMDSTGAAAPAGGWSAADALEQAGQMLRTLPKDTAGVRDIISDARGEKAYQLMRDHVIPGVLGKRRSNRDMTSAVVAQTQALAEKFANSGFARMLSKDSPTISGVFDELRYYAERNPSELVDPFLNRTAGYLYGTHLGLNLGTVMLNLQQPFLHLSGIVGGGAVTRAYGDAAKEMASYLAARAKIPRLIDSVERNDLMRKHFKYADEMGLTGDALNDLDVFLDSHRLSTGKMDFNFITVEGPMKLFEKSEWMNRLVTAHAVKHNYIQRGLGQVDDLGVLRFADDLTEQGFRADIKQSISNFQFGADVLGTPFLMFPGASQVLGTPEFFSNPLMRQFQSFGLRALTSLAFTGAEVAGGLRTIRGTNIDVPYQIADTLRMVGMSALLYEGFKGAIGADISRAGAVESLQAFFDPQRAMAGDSPFVVPPVLSISTDAIRGLLGGDTELVGNAMARVVPGGVALQRALQVAPDAKANFITSLAAPSQKFYAEYGNMNADGLVPIRKSDNTLVDFKSPTELVLRGLGINLSLPQYSRDVDGYMVRQRSRMNDYRRKWADAVIYENDLQKAQKIEAEFQKQYGFRLPITKDQMKAYIKGMETPRSLRMMDRVAPELRTYFQQEMARNPERLGTEARAITDIPTTADRRRAFGTETPVELSPEVLDKIKRSISETEAQRERLSFEPFEGF